VDFHAWKAVEAFSTGRLLPLLENPRIHAERMRSRTIGTPYETRYATMTGPSGFSRRASLRLRLTFFLEPAMKLGRRTWWRTAPLRDTAYFWPIRWLYRRLRALCVAPLETQSR
jgi:hypothetical protein